MPAWNLQDHSYNSKVVLWRQTSLHLPILTLRDDLLATCAVRRVHSFTVRYCKQVCCAATLVDLERCENGHALEEIWRFRISLQVNERRSISALYKGTIVGYGNTKSV
jgi:hypothetical protein